MMWDLDPECTTNHCMIVTRHDPVMSSVKGRTGHDDWEGPSQLQWSRILLANSKEQGSVKRDTSCLTFNTDLFSNQHLLFSI